MFLDTYAKDKFARYLFRLHENPNPSPTKDDAHRAIEESQLFIEAAFACYGRITDAAEAGGARGPRLMAVDLQRLNVKLYLEPGSSLPPEETFRVFSQWIPESRDEILIDVADYAHTSTGAPRPCSSATTPTTSSTHTDGRLGLLYGRKTETNGPAGERLREAFAAALKACRRLEEHPDLAGKVRFRGSEALVIVNDRLRAPNTEATLEALRGDLDGFLAILFPGGSVGMQRDTDPRERLALRIEAQEDPPIASLLARIEA